MTTPPRRHHEEGSAYIVALLVLIVLSMIGLGLAIITQSEQQIGSNELQSQRAFYGAESGLNLALSRVLTVDASVQSVTLPAVQEMTFTVPEQRSLVKADGTVVPVTPVDGGPHFASHVAVSPFVPIRDAPCDMCPAAEGDVQLVNVTNAVVANAQRITWNGDDDPYDEASDPTPTVLARKQIFVMYAMQPWWPPRWEAIADQAEVQKVTQEWHSPN